MGVYPVIAAEFDQVSAVFYNPNIAPKDEYCRRRDTCAEYAADQNIAFFEICVLDSKQADNQRMIQDSDDRALSSGDSVFCKGKDESRCDACYQQRLERVALWAVEHGCDAFATTLSISPWQNLDAINQAGQTVQKMYCSLHFVARDFRSYYREAQKMARNLGIYCQNYCGCLPSKTEADEQRAARRSMRNYEQANTTH